MDDRRKTTDVPGYRQRVLSETSSGNDRQNGASTSYQQTVTPSRPPTRAEVEAQLQAASSSITSRLESLQSEMGLDGKLFADLASRPFMSMAIAAGVGYAVGRLLKSLTGNRDRGDSALADLLTDEVLHALDGEEPIHDAIQRVLSVADLREGASSENAGFFRYIAGMALRSIVGQSIKEVARRFASGDDGDE